MTYLLWLAPALALIAALASGRVGVIAAALAGLGVAVLVALTTAPHPFPLDAAGMALVRGLWLGWIVTPYILGGVLFWQVAMRTGDAAVPVETGLADARAKRRLLFTACFLVGPFAEAVAGFGVGIIGTMAVLRRLNLPTVSLLAMSLLSQTMIVWGGMGSGAIVGAAYARTDAASLALHAGLIFSVMNLLWLPLYWRMAERAGVGAGWGERLSELGWLSAGMASTLAATTVLGPEVAMLATYSPIVVLRYLIDERPDRATLAAAARRMAPLAMLIGWLTITRLVAPLEAWLKAAVRIEPFAGGPVWSPLYHAGSWLLAAAILIALARGHGRRLPRDIAGAWRTGRVSVASIAIFSMMAEVLSGSGIANGLAEGLLDRFGRSAILITPLASAIFGALANSGNAANGLFMASQVGLATAAGLNVAAVMALQHAGALSLNMLSPVRMAIVCGLAETPGRERSVYREMWPYAVVVLLTLLCGSALITAFAP